MEIQISRSGGFAGVDEELARVDTAALDAQQATALESRLDEVGFFTLPSELPTPSVGADQFTYSVTVGDDRGSHTVSYRDDGTGTSGAGPLSEVVEMVLGTSPA